MRQRQPQRSTANLKRSHLAFVAVLMLVGLAIGCDRVIHHSISREANVTPVEWIDPVTDSVAESPDANNASARYQWPLKEGNYVVSKPAPMGYLNEFSKPFSMDERFEASLVKCSDLNLNATAKAFLTEAYAPPPTEMQLLVEVAKTDFNGAGAFDLSTDGERLIVLNGDEVVLYNLSDAKRVGSFSLPGDWPNAAPDLIRFCGESNDFLIGSNQKLCRVSGRTGAVVAQADLHGDPIVQCETDSNDRVVALLTSSGNLFYGDLQLKKITPIDTGERFVKSMGLAKDGSQIVVDVGGPFVFNLEEEGEVTSKDLFHGYSGKQQTVVAGDSSHLWLDGHHPKVLHRNVDSEGEATQKFSIAHCYWKPSLAAPFSVVEGYNSFVAVGRRLTRQGLQWILFDLGPVNHAYSYPIVLAEKPMRLLCSDDGEVVVLLQNDRIKAYRRQVWKTPGRWRLSDLGYQLVNESPMRELEKLHEAIGRQTRINGAGSPSELQYLLLTRVSYRWLYLEKQGDQLLDKERQVLEKIKQWHQQGGALAKSANGFRLRRLAWEARGTGTVDTVSAQGFETFYEKNQQAEEELAEVVEQMDKPPILALSTLVAVRLDLEHELHSINELAKRTVELYPDHLGAAGEIAFKLLPQWFGEEGDLISFATAHANLYQGQYSDMVYTRLMGDSLPHHMNLTARERHTIDTDRLSRGVVSIAEHEFPMMDAHWHALDIVRGIDGVPALEGTFRRLIESSGTIPLMRLERKSWFFNDLMDFPKKMVDAAELEEG
ncbi:hypothetical protein [Roseiconus lacunae]|uniref:hypothetical protein n=1 Tax=Roseiconus lacunae TaxID=2605694 RepID=UPI001E5CB6E5|nr:hypothetical protein [Roseiconus lacunae]MCD0458265.1 hypothetical protein [Roseiconus lacunae]